jgi:hypothetical protein
MTGGVSARRIGLALPALLLLGCTHMAKARECRDLARTVNRALDQVEAGAGQEQPVALRKAAARYAALANDIERQRPTHNPELGRTVDELSSLFNQTAAALRELADATQAKQTARSDRARRRVDNLARSEKTEAERVDSLCRAP